MKTSSANECVRFDLAQDAAARLIERCLTLARITETPGETLRAFLSSPMEEVHRRVRAWMEAASMSVSIDRVGNLRGVYSSSVEDTTPRLLIASHLDTVPNAGAYDGILGVLMGLALVEASGGARFPFTIEVIGFSDEEGTRFGVPFLGSRALVHKLDTDLLEIVDKAGISISESLRQYVNTHPQAVPAELSPETIGYLEFHIEQGPSLESADLPLGVVEAIAGQSRCSITFHGCARHAGTTPMSMRRDALAGAAEWMTHVETVATQFEHLVATVGQVSVEPGAANVIPAVVRCSLDVRHSDDAIREAAVRAILGEAKTVARKRGLSVEANHYYKQPAVRLNSKLTEIVEKAAQQAGYSIPRMISGAGHDAMVMAPHLPTAMVFLRNPGGISHHPDETVSQEDVTAAIRVGLCFLSNFSLFLQKKEHSARA